MNYTNNNIAQDPQITLTANVKKSRKDPNVEVMTFSLRLSLFELVFIVNLPDEEQDSVPVYVKFKVNQPRNDKDDRDIKVYNTRSNHKDDNAIDHHDLNNGGEDE